MFDYDRRAATVSKAKDPLLRELAGKAVTVLEDSLRHMKKFPSAVQAAKKGDGLESGEVWMKPISAFWKTIDKNLKSLEDIKEDMIDSDDRFQNQARNALYISGKELIEYGLSKPIHKNGQIAYPEKIVRDWAKAHEAWLDAAFKTLKKIRGR